MRGIWKQQDHVFTIKEITNRCGSKILKKVKGVTRRDGIRIQDIRTELKLESAQEYIEQRHQLGWWGLLQRQNELVRENIMTDKKKKAWKT